MAVQANLQLLESQATIGLICFIRVEILLHPARSATLAKIELSRTLGALQECFQEIGLLITQKEISGELREKHKKLKCHVSVLENFIAEAELEANFWFQPFHCGCYNKLLRSIYKMAYLLPFIIHQIESQAPQRVGISWEEIREQINNDLEHLTDKPGSLLECLDEVLLVKSLAELEKELQMKNVSHDLELGKSPNADVSTRLGPEQNNIAEIGRTFLQHTMGAIKKTEDNEVEEKLKSQMVLCLSSLEFCITNLKIETIEIEKEITYLLKWENPARHVKLHALLSKLNVT